MRRLRYEEHHDHIGEVERKAFYLPCTSGRFNHEVLKSLTAGAAARAAPQLRLFAELPSITECVGLSAWQFSRRRAFSPILQHTHTGAVCFLTKFRNFKVLVLIAGHSNLLIKAQVSQSLARFNQPGDSHSRASRLRAGIVRRLEQSVLRKSIAVIEPVANEEFDPSRTGHFC